MPDDDTTILKDKPLDGAVAKEETTAPKKTVKGGPQGGGPQFLPKLLNQKVTLRLISGQPVTGELIGFNAYELLLKTPKGPHLVFKGGILWIEGGSY